MASPLRLFISCFFIFFHSIASAQNHIYHGPPLDSTVYDFNMADSLNHQTSMIFSLIDTGNSHLWQIGSDAQKPFFANADTARGIMTDTAAFYPANANDWFILKFNTTSYNPIVAFTHKFQTTAAHDGGIVEFSYDSTLWQNVKGDCNYDSIGMGPGILTDNFYSFSDTIDGGQPAFNGTGAGWMTSAVQFFQALPIKGAASQCTRTGTVWLRFRFTSDATAENLDGWMIKEIKVIQDELEGAVHNVNKYRQLSVYPNPSTTGIVNFPALTNEKDLSIQITNFVGSPILNTTYTHKVDLSAYPAGIYIYKVTNGSDTYTGKISIQ